MFKASDKNASILQQLPSDLWPVAERLIAGSDHVYRQFVRHQQRVTRYRHDHGILFQPSLRTRAADLLEAFQGAGDFVTAHIRRSRRDHRLLADQPVNLQDAQRPILAIAGCSDSRVQIIDMLDTRGIGETFMLKNIGGSLEDPRDPGSLSDNAKEFIVLAKSSLGIRDLIILTHGKCGCIANAAEPRHRISQDNRTLEEAVFQTMALRKGHILNAVRQNGVGYYLDRIDHPRVEGDQAKLLAMEIAHGLHTRELVTNFIRGLNPAEEPAMRVALVHKELRTLDPHIYNPETACFVRLTQHPALPDMDRKSARPSAPFSLPLGLRI